MDQSMKKKLVCNEAGKEKRTSYRAVWLEVQRHVYFQQCTTSMKDDCWSSSLLLSSSIKAIEDVGSASSIKSSFAIV